MSAKKKWHSMFESSSGSRRSNKALGGCLVSVVTFPFVAIWAFVRGCMGKGSPVKKRRRG